MKPALTKVFAPLLSIFETGDEPEHYLPSHRKILLIMGFLFLILSGVSLYFTFRTAVIAALFPTLIFAAIGFVCILVGYLGTNRAVSNIWRSTRQTRENRQQQSKKH